MSLAISYDSIRREIGRHLGLDRDPTNWPAYTSADIDDLIAAGMRSALNPPPLPGEVNSHKWTFLNPLMTLKLKAGVEDYLMPSSFAGLQGDITFRDAENGCSGKIEYASEFHIRQYRQNNSLTSSTYPRYVGIRVDPQLGTEQQRSVMMVWPTPQSDTTIEFQYYIRVPTLSPTNPATPGGPEHAEMFRSAILAAVELHMEDQHGPQYNNFLQRLQSSVSYDRGTSREETLGYNGDPESAGSDGFDGYVRYAKFYP